MLKRNFVLLGLLVLISLVYVNYKPSENIVYNQNSINNDINLYSITEIDEIKIKLDTEQYIVLNLWASWCTPCIEEVEELKELANNDNYYVIGLLVDDSEKNGKEFINEYKLNYENILLEDNVENILTKFSWNGLPTTLILDKNFIVLTSFSGPITYDLISSYSG